MKPAPCPFCGAAAIGRADGPDCRPFLIRCSDPCCPGYNTSQSYADSEVALRKWNQRVQLPPSFEDPIADVWGFTTRDLIRGELVSLTLDRTGVFQSDKIAFSPHST